MPLKTRSFLILLERRTFAPRRSDWDLPTPAHCGVSRHGKCFDFEKHMGNKKKKKTMERKDVLVQKRSLLCKTGSFCPGCVSGKWPHSNRSFSCARTWIKLQQSMPWVWEMEGGPATRQMLLLWDYRPWVCIWNCRCIQLDEGRRKLLCHNTFPILLLQSQKKEFKRASHNSDEELQYNNENLGIFMARGKQDCHTHVESGSFDLIGF